MATNPCDLDVKQLSTTIDMEPHQASLQAPPPKDKEEDPESGLPMTDAPNAQISGASLVHSNPPLVEEIKPINNAENANDEQGRYDPVDISNQTVSNIDTSGAPPADSSVDIGDQMAPPYTLQNNSIDGVPSSSTTQDDTPGDVSELELEPKTAGVPSINLGSSIFQQRTPQSDMTILKNQHLLAQQKMMADLFKKSRDNSIRREEEQPTNPDGDMPIYQGQQIIMQEETSFVSPITYDEAKREYARKRNDGTLTLSEETEFVQLERRFSRQQKKARHEVPGHEDSTDDDEDDRIFVTDRPGKRGHHSQSNSTGSDDSFIQDAQPRKKARSRPSKTSAKSKAASKRSKKRNLGHINNRSHGVTNVFADIEAAKAFNDEQPTFDVGQVGKNRSHALHALMNNVPESSRASAAVDKTRLNKALRDFTGNGSVKPAEGGKWLVNGMTTSLTPHQILGTAFMRRRENLETDQQPKGGILADQMGLGKTLMTLANIVNGRPNPKIAASRHSIAEDQNYTTLIVVPSALLTQWRNEILKHTIKLKRGKGWGIDMISLYTENGFESDDADDLLIYDIVLTTYHEVAKGWPVLDVPDFEPSPEGEAEKEKWYNENFFPKRGPLHKTKFLRICLDEAHNIRNADTRVSTACRNLVGQHCWAITGTPMVNGSFDLFALYDFIGHPSVTSQTGFKKKFCDSLQPMSWDKISEDLHECMNRSTHRDQLFGARLVNLPKASENVVALHFTRLEQQIYEIVRVRFATRVQQMAKDGSIQSKFTHIFVLMLRLRQLTSHPLMIQGEICSCLEREDFEKLERLVENEDSVRGDGANLILSIRNILAKEREIAERRFAADHQDGADEKYQVNMPTEVERGGDRMIKHAGGSHGKNMRFSKYLGAIKASQTYQHMNGRTRCTVCAQPPDQPYITDCFHMYCKVCLEDLMHEAAQNGNDKASCASCAQEMTAKPIDIPSDEDEDDEEGADGKKKKKKSKRDDGDDMADWLDMKGEVLPSTKTIATKSQILNWWDPLIGGDPNVKIIIFTQWLGMVKVLGKMCESEKWGYSTLVGTMSRKKKDAELKMFKEESEKRILISSLKCGGIGLNLTVASKVIIIDPWWNDAIEQQAFCRVFRIGQDKETSMVSLAIKDSIDDRLFELKQHKKIEIEKVMLNHKERRKVDLRIMLSVFGDVDEDENGRLIFTDLNSGGTGSSEDEMA